MVGHAARRRLRRRLTELLARAGLLEPLRRGHARLVARQLDARAARVRPRMPHGRVVVTGLTPDGFHGRGKADPFDFFVPFAQELAAAGLETRFVADPAALARLSPPLCLIHVHNEEADGTAPPDAALPAAMTGPVFNAPATAACIASKPGTAERLEAHGIAVPARILRPAADRTVFSSAVTGSGLPAFVLASGDVFDPSRHNTDFVDTRVTVDGVAYYTTPRLICVGGTLVHAYVRARPAAEGRPSVHAADTPRDPDLIEHLQRVLVEANRARLVDLARSLGDALGPGFYAHDLLVCNRTGAILVCETGYKFNDMAYTGHLAPIAAQLASHRLIFGPDFARASARAFLAELRRLARV